jgi:N utilization substance protein A
MEQKQFVLAINQICEEKGISKEKAIEIVEAALASAYKKDYGKKGQIIKVDFDEKTSSIKAFQIKIVAEETGNIEDIEEDAKKRDSVKEQKDKNVQDDDEEKEQKKRFNPERNLTIEEAKKYKKDPQIGDEIEIELPAHSEFGRIAAQTAKQVMIQKIREAEKEAIFSEFKDREGEVVNGVVQRIEGRNVFVDVGRAVGILYPNGQISNEHYETGQRLKVYIEKIDKESKESNLILSRTNPEILKKMFELEVPEIAAGTVEIKSISREAGARSKVAVYSNEEGIDPVGSCVGQRGARIQTIISELGGEKIDIIEWSNDTEKYIQHSLSPAKVAYIDIKEKNKSAIAYVEEDQLSLAIGKQGQNVRLAAKLTGWKIDVLEKKKEEEKAEKNMEEEKDIKMEVKETEKEDSTDDPKEKIKKTKKKDLKAKK